MIYAMKKKNKVDSLYHVFEKSDKIGSYFLKQVKTGCDENLY